MRVSRQAQLNHHPVPGYFGNSTPFNHIQTNTQTVNNTYATQLAAAQAAGWVFVSLGDTILRSSTAAVAGASSLINWRTLSS